MADQNQADRDEWQSEWLKAVYRVAETLKELERSNPYPDNPLLPQAMNYLMTELWDRGFSQTQIKQAFEAAVSDMRRYAAGEETRS